MREFVYESLNGTFIPVSSIEEISIREQTIDTEDNPKPGVYDVYIMDKHEIYHVIKSCKKKDDAYQWIKKNFKVIL